MNGSIAKLANGMWERKMSRNGKGEELERKMETERKEARIQYEEYKNWERDRARNEVTRQEGNRDGKGEGEREGTALL